MSILWQEGYEEGRRMGAKTAIDERNQLRAEVEALRNDAGRYRWMRDVAPRLLVKSPLIEMCNSDGSVIRRDHGSEMLLSGESADKAIDAAMAKESNTND